VQLVGDVEEVTDGDVDSHDVAVVQLVDVMADVDEGGDGAPKGVQVDDTVLHVP